MTSTALETTENTVGMLQSQGAVRLQGITETPRLEAELLAAHVLNSSRAALHAHPEQQLSADQALAYFALVDRRLSGEPLPYLTGHIEFFGLDFQVNADVLIPRPETETLVELALHFFDQRRRWTDRPSLADVGAGSGCIAVALATQSAQTYIYALDLSPDALNVARTNARHHGVDERITFLQSDLLAALPEPVDLVVSNPPYIAADEWPALPREVRQHEPRLALHGGVDGLKVIRRLLRQAAANLKPGGAVLIEIGATQGPAALEIARALFADAEIALHTDLAGHDRVLGIQTHANGKHDEPR